MMRVMLLGTSGSSPTKHRGLPSAAIIYNGNIFLFDCGEGTQMQMLKFGVNIYKVKAIFVTHVHGDHIIGIAGLVRTLTLNNRKEPLLIFVPRGYEVVAERLLSFDRAIINYPIIVKGVRSGKVYEGDGFSVAAVKLKHTISAYGYIFKEDDRLRFVKEKAKEAGLIGKMFSEIEKRRRIKVGKKTVLLKDVTWLQKGKKIAYITDTRFKRSIAPAIKGADLLIHESMYAAKDRKLAIERNHSTAQEAATIARLAKVRRLLLFHISPRYRNARPILEEAKKVFAETVVGKDGYSIYI